jgi:hypothetical protein
MFVPHKNFYAEKRSRVQQKLPDLRIDAAEINREFN